MFYILIIISIIFISIGVYIDRKRIVDAIFLKLSRVSNVDELDKMEDKIRELEKKLGEFSEIEDTRRSNFKTINPKVEEYIDKIPFTDIELDMKENEFDEVYEEVVAEKEEMSLHSKIKMIQKCEDEKKGIDEICKLMDMKKGEILLLKKLYKKS